MQSQERWGEDAIAPHAPLHLQLNAISNRQQQQVEIYRPNRQVEILPTPQTLSGEDVLPGFVLDLAEIW